MSRSFGPELFAFLRRLERNRPTAWKKLVGSRSEAVSPGFEKRFLRFCRGPAAFNGFPARGLGLDR